MGVTAVTIDGHTMYDDGNGRQFGSMHEALVSFNRISQETQLPVIMTLTAEEKEWIKIIRAARGDTGLTDLLDRVKMQYILGKQ